VDFSAGLLPRYYIGGKRPPYVWVCCRAAAKWPHIVSAPVAILRDRDGLTDERTKPMWLVADIYGTALELTGLRAPDLLIYTGH